MIPYTQFISKSLINHYIMKTYVKKPRFKYAEKLKNFYYDHIMAYYAFSRLLPCVCIS